jgi:hypothetical protein
MQEMQAPDGTKHREVFSGYTTKKALDSAMQVRRAQLEQQGYKLVARAKIGRNDPCPCGSGAKFKRCCVSLVKRAGGGTFVKLPPGKVVKPLPGREPVES